MDYKNIKKNLENKNKEYDNEKNPKTLSNERIILFEENNCLSEEENLLKFLKEKVKNDQPFKILFEICQKSKFNTPEVLINPIGKNDQFQVKIFVSDFYFYGDGTAQSKKEGKSKIIKN